MVTASGFERQQRAAALSLCVCLITAALLTVGAFGRHLRAAGARAGAPSPPAEVFADGFEQFGTAAWSISVGGGLPDVIASGNEPELAFEVARLCDYGPGDYLVRATVTNAAGQDSGHVVLRVDAGFLERLCP